MPEENFEEQARKLAESFAMQPKPAVWAQVQAAIAPPKRKRRALLWWWLLPLCAAGVLSIWLAKNGMPDTNGKSSLANEKQIKKERENQYNNVLVDSNKKVLQREKEELNDSSVLHELPVEKNSVFAVKKDELRLEKKDAITKKKFSDNKQTSTLKNRNEKRWQLRKMEIKNSMALHVLPDEQNEGFIVKKQASNTRKRDTFFYHSDDARQSKKSEKNLANHQAEKEIDTTEISNKEAALSTEKKAKLYDENKADSILIISTKEKSMATDTASSNAMTARVAKDSVQQKMDRSAAADHQKKKEKHTYSFGVLAELGTTSFGSPLFGNTDKNSQAAALSFPAGNSFDLTDNNSGNATVTQSSVKKGVDLSLGLSVQKKLSKSFYFSGQIAYRYQQFGISQTIFLDTIPRNSTGVPASGTGGIYYHTDATERLHFANIYTGIGWQFFTKKKTSLSLQAGVDNALLLSVSQKQKGQADTIKNISTNHFYQWQPFVHLTLPFDWYISRKTHFELSPFVRFGVRGFQKNSASSQHNHLASSGVQFIYFFK